MLTTLKQGQRQQRFPTVDSAAGAHLNHNRPSSPRTAASSTISVASGGYSPANVSSPKPKPSRSSKAKRNRPGPDPKADPKLQPHEEETSAQQQKEQERFREQRRLRDEALAQQRQKAEEQRRRNEEAAAARHREELETHAAHTLQTVVSGAIVTLGAGLRVQHVVTGFECCKILVKNVPHNVRPDELIPIFVENGLDQTRFYVENRRGVKGGQEFTVIAHGDDAQALMRRVDDIELRGKSMDIEMGVYNGVGGMGANERDRAVNLKVTFFAPSSRWVAEYLAPATAQRKLRELEGAIVGGRKVKVAAGRSPTSIVLNNLPPDDPTLGEQLYGITGALTVQRIPTPAFDVENAISMIRTTVLLRHRTAEVTTLNRGSTQTGIVTLSIGGLNEQERQSMRTMLEGSSFHFLGRSKLRVYLPDPMYFTILIPTAQYRAQSSIWDELDSGIKNKTACRLKIMELPYGHRIQVAGSDKAAVGALKVRAEGVAAGTSAPGWHHSIADSPQRLSAAVDALGAHLKVDFRQRAFKLYGPPKAVQDAIALLQREIELLNAEEKTYLVPRHAVRHFLTEGVEELNTMFSDACITFNITTRSITYKGGDNVLLALQRASEQAVRPNGTSSEATDDVLCQICYMPPTSPRVLLCQHSYCTGCLHHLFNSAKDADSIPLLCMGADAKCKAPFPIPLVQEFLTKQDFEKLLEIAFTSHVDKRPEDFRRCATPDCTQIYRRQTHPAKLSCPSCFSEVCAACGDDAHGSISCEEHRKRNDKDEHERLTREYFESQAETKRCPRCSMMIFRYDGCNHMQCR